MPKTTVQKVIFGLLMSFFMVLAMEMYNTGLRNGGLTNAGILNALRELPLMFALCFLTSTVVGEPLAARLAARLAVPREWPFAAVLARSAMTVCVMCPAMSLWATVIFQQPGIELVPSWLQTVVCNFPMAFFWQHRTAGRQAAVAAVAAAAVPAAGALRGACTRLCGRGGGMRDMCKRSRTLVRPGPLAIIPPGAFLNR